MFATSGSDTSVIAHVQPVLLDSTVRLSCPSCLHATQRAMLQASREQSLAIASTKQLYEQSYIPHAARIRPRTTHAVKGPHISRYLQTSLEGSNLQPQSWLTSTFPSATAKISPAPHNFATLPWLDGLSVHALRFQQTMTTRTSPCLAADPIAVSVHPTTILHSSPTISTKAAMPAFQTHTTIAQHHIRVGRDRTTTTAPDSHSTKPRAPYIVPSTAPFAKPRDWSGTLTAR